MEHPGIDEELVLERYVQGRLDPEDENAFEAHLLTCDACFEQVRWADDLGGAVKVAARDEITRRTVEAGLLARLLRRPGAGFVLGIAIAALPTFLYLQERAAVEALSSPRNASLVTLGELRGDDGRTGAAVVTLGEAPRVVVLAVPLDRVDFASYSLVLRASDGELIWRRDDLVPDASDRLVIGLQGETLPLGSHALEVFGNGSDAAVGRFELEVRR